MRQRERTRVRAKKSLANCNRWNSMSLSRLAVRQSLVVSRCLTRASESGVTRGEGQSFDQVLLVRSDRERCRRTSRAPLLAVVSERTLRTRSGARWGHAIAVLRCGAMSAAGPSVQLERLAAVVRGWVEAMLHRTARTRELVQGVPKSRYAVAAADVVRLLADAERPGGEAVAAATEEAWRGAVSAGSRFAALRDGASLDDAAARVVAVLAALEHDPDLERACAYAWDDFTRKRPDGGFLVDLVAGDDEAARDRVRAALAPDGALRALRIALVGSLADADTVPPSRRTVRLADRIIAYLQGDDGLDPLLDGVMSVQPPTERKAIVMAPPILDVAAKALRLAAGGAPARALLLGPVGVGKTMVVRALAAEVGRPVVRVDVGELLRGPDRLDERMARIGREAMLRRAVVVLRGGTALEDQATPLAERLAELARRLPCAVVFTNHVRPPWLVHAVPELVEVVVPAPGVHEREALWRAGLGADRALVDDDTVEEVAGRFALGGSAITRAAERAVVQGRLRGKHHLGIGDLTESARLMLQHRLGTVARRIQPGFTWDDLVLPDDTLDTIKELVAFAKHRARLLEDWGWSKKLPYGRGVSAVMAGPPGTGKTMVAQIIAGEMGYDLYLIELAQVVNKYVGETEKNLARVFDEAESSHAILFFDEADALFAKRTEVKSSNDRYANLEVNYLLQRMETYNGITLLATNLEQGLDEAFKRRVRFSIMFEMPEPPVREALWRSMFPSEVKVADDVPWTRLAEKYEMAGGYIKKAALRAAARAIARGKDATVTAADLELSATLEYREMGRVG
jgi:ATP-dependent 26S proteasome regulatory subunit